jgi:hypothetical protein
MKQFITNSATRRSFLKGTAACFSVPFLETFATAQAAVATPPKRMIFLGCGFGFTKETFYPTEAGRFADIGLTEGLSPLHRHQDDITMVSNLTNLGASGPHSGSTSYLTGANVKGTPGKQFFNSISCDQVAARHLGRETRFPSLALADSKSGGNYGHGTGNPLPGLEHPRDLYWTLFANPNDSREEFDARLRRKQSILDVVRLDGGAVKRTLSKPDQDKLDEYFTGVRQIEKGLERQAAWADIPKPKAPFGEPAEKLTGEEEIKLMCDMIIVALQTDSTRVVTYRLPTQSVLTGMGINLQAHNLSHYGFSEPRTLASQQRDQKLTEIYGYFLDRLKEAKDSDGSRLFDNCIASWGTNIRSGHTLKNVPAIFAGGGGEKLRTGEHIILPEEDTPLANYWLTLMQQVGVPVEQFSHSTGTVGEMLV